MKRKIHICQSISGALKNWSKEEWNALAKDNKMTAFDLQAEFWKMHLDGKKVMPISQACEGFSYETGCPGHEIVEDEDPTPKAKE